jgi:hypothetical protein
MRRPRQPARSLAPHPLFVPGPADRDSKPFSPLLRCVSLLRALLLLFVADAAMPIAGVRLPPSTAKKKPFLPPHPDAALGHRRPPFDDHNWVG